MPDKAYRYLVASQLCLYGLLTLCVALIPHFLFERDEGGVSNYAVHARTVVPYTLAFGLSALCLLRAAQQMRPDTTVHRRFRLLLYVFAGLITAVLVSSYRYQAGPAEDLVHIVAAILLACFELAAAAWLALVVNKDELSLTLLAVLLATFVVAVLTFAGQTHVLLMTQILSGVAFGLLLIRSGHRLLS